MKGVIVFLYIQAGFVGWLIVFSGASFTYIFRATYVVVRNLMTKTYAVMMEICPEILNLKSQRRRGGVVKYNVK